jgi:hypothetical protein
MSWDIVLFNSQQTIKMVEDIDDEQFLPTDFGSALESHFTNIEKDVDHRRIIGQDFEIEFFTKTDNITPMILSLSGEKALFQVVLLSRKNGWQIFDTALGQMINLENPDQNGYDNFRNYLNQIKNDK